MLLSLYLVLGTKLLRDEVYGLGVGQVVRRGRFIILQRLHLGGHETHNSKRRSLLSQQPLPTLS